MISSREVCQNYYFECFNNTQPSYLRSSNWYLSSIVRISWWKHSLCCSITLPRFWGKLLTSWFVSHRKHQFLFSHYSILGTLFLWIFICKDGNIKQSVDISERLITFCFSAIKVSVLGQFVFFQFSALILLSPKHIKTGIHCVAPFLAQKEVHHF